MKTRTKINIAKVLRSIQKGISAFAFIQNSETCVSRNGINWSLDLNEGIDFSIFLFGVFERESKHLYERLSGSADIVALDIGANVGSQSLLLASLLNSDSKIYCFEPTSYAFSKLKVNLKLNPLIAHKVFPRQTFLTSGVELAVPESVYSSWLLSDNPGDVHHMHAGSLKSTVGARSETIDSFVINEKLERIDFIKLDVDGYETDVISGGKLTLEKFKPLVYFEYAPYVQQERGLPDGELLRRFSDFGYDIYDARSLKRITDTPLKLKHGESVNLIADHGNRFGIF